MRKLLRGLLPDRMVFPISFPTWMALALFPVALLFFLTVGLALPGTREAVIPLVHSDRFVREYQFVEMASFAMAFLASILGFWLAVRTRADRLQGSFFFVFSLGLLFIAMEEVAWGQWLFYYETPEWMAEINAQNEMTLHNIGPLQGRSELFRLVFGAAGLVGLFAPMRWIQEIRVPSCLALSLVAITAFSGVDLLADIFPVHRTIDWYMARLSEAIEMLIAYVGLCYVVLHLMRRKVSGWPGTFDT